MTNDKETDKFHIPRHIAIIMDGNGRWAKKQGMLREYGHRSGTESVREAVRVCRERGVQYLTLYAFSQENWNRPKEEVAALMELLMSQLAAELPSFIKNGIRVKAIGRIDDLPQNPKSVLMDCIEKTKHNSDLTLTLALSYGSQTEITDCIKAISAKVLSGELSLEQIDQKTVEEHLYTKDYPPVDLMIRTSGELRVSNFMLWQIAYSELYFTPVLWPDFSGECLLEAIEDYSGRERRFGKTSEQIQIQKI